MKPNSQSHRILKGALLGAVVIATLGAAAPPPAKAWDGDGWRERQAWREHEAWRERREAREREWRWRHSHPYYGYYRAPAYGYYAYPHTYLNFGATFR